MKGIFIGWIDDTWAIDRLTCLDHLTHIRQCLICHTQKSLVCILSLWFQQAIHVTQTLSQRIKTLMDLLLLDHSELSLILLVWLRRRRRRSGTLDGWGGQGRFGLMMVRDKGRMGMLMNDGDMSRLFWQINDNRQCASAFVFSLCFWMLCLSWFGCITSLWTVISQGG